MEEDEYTPEEIEELWELYREEKKHYPFGELGEKQAPPPFTPKKKDNRRKVKRDKQQKKRIV